MAYSESVCSGLLNAVCFSLNKSAYYLEGFSFTGVTSYYIIGIYMKHHVLYARPTGRIYQAYSSEEVVEETSRRKSLVPLSLFSAARHLGDISSP